MILIKYVIYILCVGLAVRALYWLEDFHERNSWLGKMKRKQAEEREQANMRTCPTCGARTSANRLVAHAPPHFAPQDSTPPARPHPQT